MATETQIKGFLLLTIDNAQLIGPNLNERGLLYLECITIAAPPNSSPGLDRDVWLTLRMNGYEAPISPLDPITHSKVNNTYLFHDHSGVEIVLTMPTASDLALAADLETFQVLLEQYGVVQYESDDGATVTRKGIQAEAGDAKEPAAPIGGRLVLVDEEDGHVVGTLEEGIKIEEDNSLALAGNEKAPVVIQLPEEPGKPAIVSTVNPEDYQGAFVAIEYLSRGIILASSALSSGMESAATYYISKATPREKPVVFSERTKGNIKRVHGISGKAFEVTSKTTKLIHENIDRMVGVLGRKKVATQKPPLPSRPGEKSGHPSSYPGTPTSTPGTSTPPSSSKEKPRFINRLLISTDLLLTTLEKSGKGLLDSGTQNIARSLSHKYGQDTGNATMMIGGTFQNVGAVYIDARGIGRRALLKRAGKNVVKGVIGGKQVVFGAEAQQATARSQGQAGLGSGSGSNPSGGPMASSPISAVDNKPPLPPRKLSPAPPPYATYSRRNDHSGS